MFRPSNRFGRGTGAILFDDMNCDGTEASLRATSCLSRYSNPEFYCSHSSDVGVRCDSIGGSGECYFSAITNASTMYRTHTQLQVNQECMHSW